MHELLVEIALDGRVGLLMETEFLLATFRSLFRVLWLLLDMHLLKPFLIVNDFSLSDSDIA